MTSIYDVLKASKGLPVDDIFAELWGRKLASDYTIDVYTGELPATLTGTKAGELHRYKIYGNVGENLWDNDDFWDNGHRFELTSLFGYAYIVSPGTYTVSTNVIDNVDTSIASVFAIAANPNLEPSISSSSNGVFVNRPRTVTVSENQALWIVIRVATQGSQGYLIWNRETFSQYWIMLTEGSTAPESYIPYEACGERTENLAWTGWAEDFVTRVANASNAKLETIDGRNTVYFTANTGYGSYDTKYIFKTDWKENTVYTFSFEYFRQTAQTVASILAIKYTDGTTATLPQYQKGDWYKMTYSTAPNKTVEYLQAYYVSGNLNIDIDTFMVVEGSTAPTAYEPYGYKLPLTSGSTPVDIYIGDDTLSTEEYVDSGTGKIYRMVGGTLTPVDPPVPFPQIPTSANSTTISWAGEGLAPSEVEFEYERK